MEYLSLIDPHLDYDHWGRLLHYYVIHDSTHPIEALQCHTPNDYWMIHPDWVTRYKSNVFLVDFSFILGLQMLLLIC
jgi:hypothetical protein